MFTEAGRSTPDLLFIFDKTSLTVFETAIGMLAMNLSLVNFIICCSLYAAPP